MKVSTEHFNILVKWMQSAMTAQNVTREIWDNTYAGYTEQRKLWDLFHATMNHSAMSRNVIRPIFYEYNDTHIETALKAAYKQLI